MADSNQGKFAYDFEQPIVEIEKEIRELTERDPAQSGAEEGRDISQRVQALEERRDELLEETFENLTAYQRVLLARHPARPHPTDYVASLFENFMELHGDRRFGDDRAIVTGLGRLEEHKVMVVAMHKGKETEQKLEANFGMPQPEGYRKALQKMQLAEKFALPVVCLIDTPGAACAVDAEERGQAMAIAENIFTMSRLATPIVILVTGEGCSGGALGIGVGDRFAMLENAYYSVITPEGLAAILWKDGEKGAEAAEAMKLTAADMLEAGIIEQIVPEPLGGAHRDPQTTTRNVEAYLTDTLDELTAMPVDRLLEERYRRYRRLGVFRQAQPARTEESTEAEEPAETRTTKTEEPPPAPESAAEEPPTEPGQQTA
ncbi:MAG: acetyl-CoA carboxylase carboxyltransferase subunit alpha [Planctomycetota bacterium]